MKIIVSGYKSQEGARITLKRRDARELDFKRKLPDFFTIELDSEDFKPRKKKGAE